MTDWEIDLKWYPHFDAPISAKNAEKLVRDPDSVAANVFYPFMRYTKSWQPYRSKTAIKPAKKERPIRFASRRDAYIFSYYRRILSDRYEKMLAQYDLENNVIAYRKVLSATGGGQSNIEFSKIAFDGIRSINCCAAVALDISSFFEKLDHKRLLRQWCRVMGVQKLPPDHFSVYNAVTNYAVVDRDEVYRRLGYLEAVFENGRWIDKYTKSYKEMPKKLCSNKEFREKICGKGGLYKSLVDKNRKPFGIPQGSPISDLLANIYLIDFDRVMKDYCESRGGFYMRYSDDLLLVVPGGEAEALDICARASSEIIGHGEKLRIKDKKTAAVVFHSDGFGRQNYRHVGGRMGATGLEYLGFRYDGRNVFLRNSTLSNLYRKISGGVKAECHNLISRYPGKDYAFLISRFDFSALYQKYGRVKDFDPHDIDKWTFWTYARRASKVFGKDGLSIPKQLANYRRIIERRVRRDLAMMLH